MITCGTLLGIASGVVGLPSAAQSSVPAAASASSPSPTPASLTPQTQAAEPSPVAPQATTTQSSPQLVSTQQKTPKPPSTPDWNPTFQKFRTWEYVATGVVGAASFGAYFLLKAPSEADWTGGILFDNAARGALRAHSATGLERARKASDYTALSAVVLAFGVDSLAIPLIRGRGDVALQLLLLDAEAYSVSSLITTMTFREVGRARPSYEDCRRNPNFDRLCDSGPYSSFPSGHATSSATAAGLSCAHHLHLGLYGNKLADALACGVTSALAVSTATLRVVGDRHYVTDVLAGQAIGFGFGYGLPTLLHYAGAYAQSSSRFVLAPLAESQYGIRAIYVF